MAAVDLTTTAITHLPFIVEGTCSSTLNQVRRFNVTVTRRLVYTVLAPSVALKVAVVRDADVLADEAAAGAIKKIDVAIGGSAQFSLGPNKTGIPTASQFYVFSATADAPYTVIVDEEK